MRIPATSPHWMTYLIYGSKEDHHNKTSIQIERKTRKNLHFRKARAFYYTLDYQSVNKGRSVINPRMVMHCDETKKKQLSLSFQSPLSLIFMQAVVLTRLLLAGRANGGDTLTVLDATAGGAASLDGLDDTDGLGVSDLAEDDVTAVEPRGDDGGDEELRAVAVLSRQYLRQENAMPQGRSRNLRVGAGVGHGEEEGLVVGELEVLVGELLTVDGLATSALSKGKAVSIVTEHFYHSGIVVEVFSYVATGEVTTLEHELGDHTVELGAGVAEALLAGAEGTEVLDGLGDDIVEELEVDTAGAGWRKEGGGSVVVLW